MNTEQLIFDLKERISLLNSCGEKSLRFLVNCDYDVLLSAGIFFLQKEYVVQIADNVIWLEWK